MNFADQKAVDHQKQNRGFSAIELIVVVGIIGLLVLMVRPFLYRPCHQRSPGITCIRHLKNIGLAFQIYATDHNDRFPAVVLTNRGSVRNFDAAAHFAFLSNELSTPKLLNCPADKGREEGRSFTNLGGQNISYFSSLSAGPAQPMLWLAGDRNLIVNETPTVQGVLTLATEDQVSWTRTIHNEQGNIAMADGSVQQVSNLRVQRSLIESGGTNLLLFP